MYNSQGMVFRKVSNSKAGIGAIW